jgi:galactokinase
VPIPRELAIVAAYSGSPAPKGGEAKQDYNTRVVASRAAALCWGVPAGVDVGAPPVLSRVVAAMTPDPAELPDTASAQQVADRVGVEVDSIVRLTAERFDPELPLPVRAVGRHIVGEAARVDAAEAALRNGRLVELGGLLDASHESLRAFGASSDRLDALVTAMRSAGAWGARLTGAGFGGYAIAACAPERVEDVIGAAQAATGGEPAFQVTASAGVGPIADD